LPGTRVTVPVMAGRTYRLEVEGELSDNAMFTFEGLMLRHVAGNTLLVGTVRDQSELHGLLQHVADLGLTLVSVNQLPPARRPARIALRLGWRSS